MRTDWVTLVVVAALALVVVPAFIATVPEADAGVAVKVRCRVGTDPARVVISVGANGLVPGTTASFTATNLTAVPNTNSSTLLAKVSPLGDAAAEWDSAIAPGDPAEGTRGSIGANFAHVDDSVKATVSDAGKSSSATTKCVAK